jgi:hypothetical protein
MRNPMVSSSSPLGRPVAHTAGTAALSAFAAKIEAPVQGPSPAVVTGASAGYDPELGAIELDRVLAELLETRRQTEWLLCRYLADIAEGRRFREIGYYSDILHYARDRLGLSVKSTRERLRIGRALRALPRIERAFVAGHLSYSRVRELTRVATADDEEHWLELGRVLPMRELERRVAAVVGAAAMTDAPAEIRWRTPETVELRMQLPAEAWALLSRAMQGAREASERPMSDAEALEAVAQEALARLCERHGTDAATGDPRRAVVLYRCRLCGQSELETGAVPVPLTPAQADRLGCGAGAHSRSNCATLCTTCHTALHEGKLRAEGDADGDLRWQESEAREIAAMPSCPNAGGAEPFVVDATTVLRAMGGRGGWTADGLIEATGLGAGRVAAALVVLELDERAVSDGLGRFSPVACMVGHDVPVGASTVASYVSGDRSDRQSPPPIPRSAARAA